MCKRSTNTAAFTLVHYERKQAMRIYIIWKDDLFDDDRDIKAITFDPIEAIDLSDRNLNRIQVYDMAAKVFIEVDMIGNYILINETQWKLIS